VVSVLPSTLATKVAISSLAGGFCAGRVAGEEGPGLDANPRITAGSMPKK
jgi:hypothetical protein